MRHRLKDNEIEFLLTIFEGLVMATLETQVTALQTSVDALTASVNTLVTAGVKVDNTAVLAAIAAVQTTATDIAAQVDQLPAA